MHAIIWSEESDMIGFSIKWAVVSSLLFVAGLGLIKSVLVGLPIVLLFKTLKWIRS